MKENHFFEKQTASSKIKANIVSEYFPSYCKIIVRRHEPKQLRYIDLFAGPGYYNDGNPSTPILIARHCKNDDFLRRKVRLIFNDNTYSSELERNFSKEFPNGTFEIKPFFGNKTFGECQEITDFLVKKTHEGNNNEYPSILFIDPFGYKGIETKVLAEFLKNWGNEIFLFVNTKRIHPALENEKFETLMQDLFPTTLNNIKHDRKFKSTVSEKLSLIINNLGKEYQSILGGKIYYTAFKFQEENIDTTSHYILHITKGAKGYELIKTVYNDFANVGTIFDGINTYTFDAKKLENHDALELFDTKSENVDKLKNDIYNTYRNRKITASNLFDHHQKTSLYSRSHYTEALRRLVDEQKLISEYTDGKNHKKTVLISDTCILTFK
ncbi:MAG: three-Cys-motif partner protein TcmP [Odoribacteraceae bacterium]|jgi:three-Cys-motif partner protein|nr:three-Cys-motif partner protein TcmP [Odoribacteraceae bacterium]